MILQVEGLLDVIDNDAYARPLPILSEATIGKHIRHILDFYWCVIKGTENCEICYDNRARQVGLETDIEYTKDVIRQLKTCIQQLDAAQPIVVSTTFTPAAEEAPVKITSTVGRELMYAIDHCIHHLAIVKIGIKSHLPAIQIPEDMGVARAAR